MSSGFHPNLLPHRGEVRVVITAILDYSFFTQGSRSF
jgi:hypothetical protein